MTGTFIHQQLHRFQRKPLVSDPGMQPGTCVTHVPGCMSGSLTHGGGENVPGIPGACPTRKFTYLAICPWKTRFSRFSLNYMEPNFGTFPHVCRRIVTLCTSGSLHVQVIDLCSQNFNCGCPMCKIHNSVCVVQTLLEVMLFLVNASE